MSEIKFTPEQQDILRNNPYTAKVTASILSFTKEFKELFYKEYLTGRIPREILQEYGYPVEILGQKRIWGIAHIIKKEFEKKGSFDDVRTKKQYEKPGSLTSEEKIRHLEHQVNYLTQEVEFLKKISSIRNTRK